jgi:Amt family ammonium transporter
MVWAPPHLGQAGKGVTGLLYGDSRQFMVQVGGALLCAVWAFGATFIVFKVVNSIKSMRVSKEAEQDGLDVPEFGLLGYPEDVCGSRGAGPMLVGSSKPFK